MSVGAPVGVGATGVGSTGVAVGVAVNGELLMANAVGLGGKVRVGVGVGAGSAPQATDTNRTTDGTSSEMRSFTISSSVQGGLAIPPLATTRIHTGPYSTASAGHKCSLPTMLPCGPGVSNEENGGLWSSKKADPGGQPFCGCTLVLSQGITLYRITP